VVEGNKIIEIATTKRVEILLEPKDADAPPVSHFIEPRAFTLTEGPFYPKDDNVDVAVFRVDLDGNNLPKVPLGSHFDHEIGDNDFILSKAIVVGYPPIPFTTTPNQVVVGAEVNATIDVRHSPHVHFVVSAMARGGFSGGLVLSETGSALGIVTESLSTNEASPETGFMSVLSVEPIINIITEHFPFDTAQNGIYRDEVTLIDIRLTRPSLSRLNSRLYCANIYVYDDDRDIFAIISCEVPKHLKLAYSAFNAVASIKTVPEQSRDGFAFVTLTSNPPAKILVEAARAARDVLVGVGYEDFSTFKNTWQTK
jgi:hypothetical protein